MRIGFRWFLGTASLILALMLVAPISSSPTISRTNEDSVSKAGPALPCPEGRVICDKECVDKSSSIEHCGSCKTSCFANQLCKEGACGGIGVLGVEDLKARLEGNKDFLLINVRHPSIGVIPGTDASIPATDIEGLKAFIGDNLDRRVVIYCGRSVQVQYTLRILGESGYRSVSFFAPGISGWRSAGLPLDPE